MKRKKVVLPEYQAYDVKKYFVMPKLSYKNTKLISDFGSDGG